MGPSTADRVIPAKAGILNRADIRRLSPGRGRFSRGSQGERNRTDAPVQRGCLDCLRSIPRRIREIPDKRCAASGMTMQKNRANAPAQCSCLGCLRSIPRRLGEISDKRWRAFRDDKKIDLGYEIPEVYFFLNFLIAAICAAAAASSALALAISISERWSEIAASARF